MLEKLLSLFGLGRKRAALIVTVPAGRSGCGLLRAFGRDGKELLGTPIPVAARADAALARAHGNPARDVLRPYGDPACGTYLLIAIDRLAEAPEPLRDELGETQLLFEPSEGDAAKAEAGGRLLLALHGGRLGVDDRLRPTSGGLRMSGRDLETLLRVLSGEDQWRLEMREEAPRMLPAALSSEPAGVAVDPPIPYSVEAKRAIERRESSPGSDDDSWRYRHDDDWRSSRDTYSSSGPAVAAATGAVAGAAAAHGAENAPESAAWHGGPVASSESESGASQDASGDAASGTSY